MEGHWVDGEQVRASLRSEGMLGHACWLLGAVFAVLGLSPTPQIQTSV